MTSQRATRTDHPPRSIGDGVSVLIGSLAGAGGGALLGGLIAWTVSPGWSLTSGIIIFHVTLAMIAMGAWTAPSLISDPAQEVEPAKLPAQVDVAGDLDP